MDLLDLANGKVFGNRHFRPKQREIITAALQVILITAVYVSSLTLHQRVCSCHRRPDVYDVGSLAHDVLSM